ncbi:MAG TPA: 5-oxoprolinase subunit PxpA [Anaerolineaceae bacterium]
MKSIDINCDMGESFGKYILGNDSSLMELVSSVNIACGMHAGDPLVMQTTVRLAKQKMVAVGAHPGYPDLQGFGRRAMDMTPEEVESFILYQIGALWGFCRGAGVDLVHVKPHGALYNQAAKDAGLAAAIARAVKQFSQQLILVGLAGSQLVNAGEEVGLRVVSEGFPDRAYNLDGSLRSRREPGALLHDPILAAEQAVRLADQGIRIESGSGLRFSKVQTLCIHGDEPGALENATAIRQVLEKHGFTIKNLV